MEMLKELINQGESRELIENLTFLNQERIKIVGNRLRKVTGRPLKEIHKDQIIESVKKINKISSEKGSKFHINENWEEIEKFLCLTILEDISKEFEKQKEE